MQTTTDSTIRTTSYPCRESWCCHHVNLGKIMTEDTYQGMVYTIEYRIAHLHNYGSRVKGVTITDAKQTCSEILGMIGLLQSVAEAPTVVTSLLKAMADARVNALKNLRSK